MSGEGSGEDAPSLSESVLEQIYRHARAEFPRECCGYLRGPGPELEFVPCKNIQDELHAEDPEMFPRTAETAYCFDFGQARAFDASFRSERPANVVYHSHPKVGAYFSAEDARAAIAWGYAVDHLVVDVQEDRVVEALLFRRDGETFRQIARFPGRDL